MAHHDHQDISIWQQLPLRSNSKSIRLLELLDEGPASHITCSLSVVSFDAIPRYVALSYCWGSQSSRSAIICNGHSLVVQDNLYHALVNLRRHGYHTVWADAICIDQSNKGEKSQQVAIMGDVYERAQSTLIWLGSPSDPDSRTLDLVRKLAKIKQDISSPGQDIPLAIHLTQERLSEYGLPPWNDNYDARLESLCEVLNTPYPSRAWIIQEVLLAQGVMCMWGTEILPLDCFTDASSVLLSLPAWRAISERGEGYWDQQLALLSLLRNMLQVFRLQPSRNYDAIVKAITVNHLQTQCQDPRDKVYSLLGILQHVHKCGGPSFALLPDYTEPVESVYIRFMMELLSNSSSLNPLVFLRDQKSQYNASLPSWVIDWTGVRGTPVLAEKAEDFKTTFDSRKDVHIHAQLLRLSCQLFDTITEVSILPVYHENDHEPVSTATEALVEIDISWISRYGPILQSWIDVCPVDGDYVTGGSNAAALYSVVLSSGAEPSNSAHIMWIKSILLLIDMANVTDEAKGCDDNQATIASLPADWESIWSHVVYRNLKAKFQRPAVRMAKTSRGYYCSVPFQAEPGDEIILCSGGRFPFVCRLDDSDRGCWNLLGGCFVSGIMDGSAWGPNQTQYRLFS